MWVLVFAVLFGLSLAPGIAVLAATGMWGTFVLIGAGVRRRYVVGKIVGQQLVVESQRLGSGTVTVAVSDVRRLYLGEIPALGHVVIVDAVALPQLILSFGRDRREALRLVKDLEAIVGDELIEKRPSQASAERT